VITIQRVRVRWSAAGRGAPQANARRGLTGPTGLPSSLPPAPVMVHDVLADEATGYERRAHVLAGGVEQARAIGLWLEPDAGLLAVDRLSGWASYPPPAMSARLFTLAPGQTGRWRANFRIAGGCCSSHWSYEDWTVHVSNGPVPPDGFTRREPDAGVDDRVHLYGGRPGMRGRGRPV
jgi:hypothetical protein